MVEKQLANTSRNFLRAVLLTAIFLQLQNAAAQPLKQVRPWLGIAIGENPQGVLIKKAIEGTPAFKAGLASGDIVTTIDKIAVKTPKELIQVIQAKGVGAKIAVQFIRNNKKLHKNITLVARPDELALLKSKMLDKEAPDFDLEVIGSKSSGKLRDYRGKVVILEFWATWCPACKSTHQALNTVARNHAKDIAVLTISSEEKEVLEAFYKTAKPSFTVLRDGKGATGADWTFSAIPAMAVIDQKGVIRNVALGAGIYLTETINKALELSKKKQ